MIWGEGEPKNLTKGCVILYVTRGSKNPAKVRFGETLICIALHSADTGATYLSACRGIIVANLRVTANFHVTLQLVDRCTCSLFARTRITSAWNNWPASLSLQFTRNSQMLKAKKSCIQMALRSLVIRPSSWCLCLQPQSVERCNKRKRSPSLARSSVLTVIRGVSDFFAVYST